MNKVLSIPTLFAAVLLLVSAQFIFASNWTNPPANPPNGNTATPINVGPSNQVKEGDITADDFISLGTSPSIVFKNSNAGTDRFSNWIQFTGANGALSFKNDSNENGNFWEAGVDKYGMMIFEDHVRAAKYCDLNGENCFDISVRCNPGQVLVAGANGDWECGDVAQPVINNGYRAVVLNENEIKALITTDVVSSLGSADFAGAGIYARTQEQSRVCSLLAISETGNPDDGEYLSQTVRAYDTPNDNYTFKYNGSGWGKEGAAEPCNTSCWNEKGVRECVTVCSKANNYLMSSITCQIKI